jgi:hypothetical protein
VPLFGTFAVVVRSRDVQDIEVMLKPGAVVQGDVQFETRHGHAPPPVAGLRVRALLPNGSGFGDARGAAIRSDRTFSLDGVMEGARVLAVEGLAFPWRILEARILGQDAAHAAFELAAQQHVRGVRVVLADVAAGVSGTITVPAEASMSDVLVVAFPVDPLHRAVPARFVKAARPAADGSYQILDLAPEEYRVIAVLQAEEREATDPDVLERWVASSTPVSLAETKISVVPLTATFSTPPSTRP